MDEQFDNELKNHIREVFDHFEDPSADEGWLLLRKKFPEKEKDRGFIWLWLGSAAAILLVMLGIGIWAIHQKEEPQKLSFKPAKHPAIKNGSADTSKQLTNIPGSVNYADSKPATTDQILPQNHTRLITKTQSIKSDREDILSNPSKSTVSSLTRPPESLTVAKTDSQFKTNAEKVIAATTAFNTDTAVKTKSVITLQKPFVKPALPFTDRYDVIKDQKPNTIKSDGKRVEFGIYAATYFNYAKGSTNQVNIGAGATADIKLAKNLKLSTGLAIAQNTLNYDNQFPTQTSAIHSLEAIPSLLAANPAFSSTVAYSIPVLKNYNAQLVELDVPVNLKYEFNPEKNNSYVSVGLSSGTFLNQSYTYQYSYAAQQSQSTTTSTLNNFYFAKTLNVSFGLGYPLGKTNRLIIEPFLKYPLDGLGAQQIRFGAGGLNLKFDFQTSKK